MLGMHGHNHEAFVHPKVHPQCRTLTNEQRAVVLGSILDGLPPVRIVASMRRQNVSVTPRDVYNIKQAERRRVLGGRSPLAALLDSLEGNVSTPYFTQFDDERKLTHCLLFLRLQKKSVANTAPTRSGSLTQPTRPIALVCHLHML